MLIVKKFGGTSVADKERIFNVARRCIEDYQKGNDVVVVLSAMGKYTDELITMAKDINEIPPKREMDMLFTIGEQMSVALMAMAMNKLGVPAISLNAFQVAMHTTSVYGNARIKRIDSERIRHELEHRKIVIVTGFQGVNKYDDYTTLGRGGSDTSAVALASALNAERCDIYTDVEGVYTTDPRVVPNASRLRQISYEEMLELAHAGANVLHPRSVETAKLNHVPLRVRSSFKTDDLGTLILGVDKMEIDRPVTGVAADLSQTRVVVCDVPDIPGQAANIFTKLAAENISVDMIIQSYARKVSNTNDIAFTIDAADTDKTIETLNSLKDELNCGEIQVDRDIAKVSIVGAGMIDRPGIASSMFDTLAKLGVNIKMISTSEIKISCLVDKEDANKAVKALHDDFGLSCDVVADVKGDLPNV